MDVFSESSYKDCLKTRLRELKTKRPDVTLKRIALQVPVQYTYLSKVLNDRKLHLSEDHLFSVLQLLDFEDDEREFLSLLRDHDAAEKGARKDSLFNRIERLRGDRRLKAQAVEPKSGALVEQMSYLFDPYCVLVHAALAVPAYRHQPLLLGPKLGINEAQMKGVLRRLDACGYVELETDGVSVKALKNSRFHVGRDHPLMRAHQGFLKTLMQSRLVTSDEADKTSFLVTFTMDSQGFEDVKREYAAFMKKVEAIAERSRHESVYQIGFDLFRWL